LTIDEKEILFNKAMQNTFYCAKIKFAQSKEEINKKKMEQIK